MKKGISLITLIITIVVVIILAAVVILALGNNNPINSARVATVAQIRDSINSAVFNYVTSIKAKTYGEFSTEEILLGSLENTEKYQLIDDVIAYISEGGEEKTLYRLDKEKTKDILKMELKSIAESSAWYVDNLGKVYLVFDTKDDVVNYLKEDDEILQTVSSFVKYAGSTTEILTANITSNANGITNLTQIDYIVEFNRDVEDFDIDDIFVEHGTKDEFNEISSNKYILKVSNSGSTKQKVTIPKNVCNDEKGIKNKTASLEVEIDRDIPMLTSLEVITTSGTYAKDDEILISATYSEELYNLSKEKIENDKNSALPLVIKFGNGNNITINATSVNGNVVNYNYTITEDDNGELIFVSYQGTIYDRALNTNNINVTTLDGNHITVENKLIGSLSYAEVSVSRMLGSGTYTNPLTKVGDGTVTYSSSDETIATVNSNGEVTLYKKTGEVTITATASDTDTYRYPVNTASYQLTATAHVHSSSCYNYHYHTSSCRPVYHTHSGCGTTICTSSDIYDLSDSWGGDITSICPKCSTQGVLFRYTKRCRTCDGNIVEEKHCTNCRYDWTVNHSHRSVYTCGKTTSTIEGYSCGYTQGQFIGYNCGF